MTLVLPESLGSKSASGIMNKYSLQDIGSSEVKLGHLSSKNKHKQNILGSRTEFTNLFFVFQVNLKLTPGHIGCLMFFGSQIMLLKMGVWPR